MFSNALKTTGYYNDRDIMLFEKEVKYRQVQKDQVLLINGEVAKSVFFILKGTVYQYNLKPDNEHHIIDLHIENEWFLNHKSFVSQTPSENIIAAFTESKLLELCIESIHYLIGQSSAFLQLNKLFEGATTRVYFFDNSLTPLQKYQFIFKNKPQLLQKFSLKVIASFLKITPETLVEFARNLQKTNSLLDFNQVL